MPVGCLPQTQGMTMTISTGLGSGPKPRSNGSCREQLSESTLLQNLAFSQTPDFLSLWKTSQFSQPICLDMKTWAREPVLTSTNLRTVGTLCTFHLVRASFLGSLHASFCPTHQTIPLGAPSAEKAALMGSCTSLQSGHHSFPVVGSGSE